MLCNLLNAASWFRFVILAAAWACRAVNNSIVVKWRERNAACWRPMRDKLRVGTCRIPCLCTRKYKLSPTCLTFLLHNEDHEYAKKVRSLFLKHNIHQMVCHGNEILTEGLSGPPPILWNELSRSHILGRSASIPGSGGHQGEIHRHFNGLAWSPCLTNTDLKWCHSIGRVLCPWVEDSPFAAVRNLHIVRCPGEQVNHLRFPLATMWELPFEFWAIALLRGLGTDHFPDYLLLLPHPTEFPARRLDMAILLVVV